jgi:hypothetical protein
VSVIVISRLLTKLSDAGVITGSGVIPAERHGVTVQQHEFGTDDG